MRRMKKYTPTKFKTKDSVYDKAKADYAVSFIECLCHTKGTWAGKPFTLIDWQEQIIRDIFGIIKFFDVATFIDNSDPLQIIVTSTGGDVFKNGQGTTVLTAVCYQAGSEVDAAGNGSYTWTKYNKDGVVDTSWGTNGSKTGKTLSVSSADVDTKATFMVVVAL